MSDAAGTLRVESFVDGIEAGGLRGWAWLPEQPETVLLIELVDAADTVVASTPAQSFRGDLESAGKRGGACAFHLMIPHAASGVFSLQTRFQTQDGVEVRAVLAEGLVVEGEPVRPASPFRLGVGTEVTGWLDRADALEIAGWAHGPVEFREPLTLTLVEDDKVLATTAAAKWRTDLEDVRQGDGRCGFSFAPPAGLYDGEAHRLDIRLADGRSLLSAPLVLSFPRGAPSRTDPPEPVRPPAVTPLAFSVIVNFYNMEREAARTLASLSRRYQRDVEAVAYEVLCVDNGSDPPLREDFVASFGPEFRLVRPSAIHPSPCRAMNEAAAQAKGRWLALMIDGAHILSPGVLAEAHAALKGEPGGVVSLRQWFIGGDQRWFSSVGYSREIEDVLFAKVDWPNGGYRIFEIGAPMFESPNSWFDGMGESNCLFLPADLYQRIGGMDEAFDTPGAGFANLDLFRRASEACDGVFGLVGEASFHQYHDGTTTNVDDAEKDARVRAYASRYERVRGDSFVNLPPERIRLFGAIRSGSALTSRQRPYCPARVGVTDRVRPRPTSLQFDEEAQFYLQSAYVETGRHLTTRWRGEAVGVAPSDLIDIQEALWRSKPQLVILKEAAAGLAAFVASILPMLGLAGTRILWIGQGEHAPVDGVERIDADPYAPATLARLDAEVGDVEHVLVLFQPGLEDTLPVEPMRRYARLVSFSGYFVVLGVALGQPYLGYSRSWMYRAIVRFLQREPSFVVDRTLNQHFITTCPSGFLRRALNPIPIERYDAALDDLSGL